MFAILFKKSVKKRPKFRNSHNGKVHRFFFLSNFDVEWIVLSAFGSMLTFSSIFHRTTVILFILKSDFNGLLLNIGSYVKMNIIIFLKIQTSLNIEHKLAYE